MKSATSLIFGALGLGEDPLYGHDGDQATSDALKDCVRDLGLDRPVVVQYGEFLWKSVRLDFGKSFRQHYRVTDYILRMFPYTLHSGVGQHGDCVSDRPPDRHPVRAEAAQPTH